MSLAEKIRKNSNIEGVAILSQSKIHGQSKPVSTSVPMLNVAISGDRNGGFTSGVLTLAGPSKHFKSGFSLLMVAAYLNKYPEAVMLFYDTEFGMPVQYFKIFGIDPDRVIHVPIKNIEELKFDCVKQLESLERGERVVIVIDSIGNIASKKELDDALNEKSVADMTRAKALKGFFRMITPYLAIKDIPLFAIAHTYMEQGLYPKAIVSGGCVVEGTEILTPDGKKTIECIQPGERVLYSGGEIEVTHVWNPETLAEGTPECFEVEFEDGTKVQCSENHLFLVNGNWVQAKDLVPNMDCQV